MYAAHLVEIDIIVVCSPPFQALRDSNLEHGQLYTPMSCPHSLDLLLKGINLSLKLIENLEHVLIFEWFVEPAMSVLNQLPQSHRLLSIFKLNSRIHLAMFSLVLSLQWRKIFPTVVVGGSTRMETPNLNGFVCQLVGKGSWGHRSAKGCSSGCRSGTVWHRALQSFGGSYLGLSSSSSCQGKMPPFSKKSSGPESQISMETRAEGQGSVYSQSNFVLILF